MLEILARGVIELYEKVAPLLPIHF